MRIIRRLLAGVAVLVGAVLAVLFVADPVVTGRMLSMPFDGGLGPRVLVRGGGDGAPLAVAGPGTGGIGAAALTAAVDYGASQDSHALLVYHAGQLVLEHYYPGHGPESRTPTQSMHKSVLALLFGAALRDGYLRSVDEPAATYLTEWAGDARARITIRQLLQQASGIDYPATNYLNPAGTFLQVMMGDELAATVLAQPAEAPPGERFDYNNVNVALLGILLERATRTPYADYLERALWRPLGADDALVTVDSRAHGTPRTYCCLDATARSWLRLGVLILDGGRVAGRQVIPAEWLREVTTPSPTQANYGYLTWLGREYQEQRRYNHKSAVTAYASAPFAAPDVIYFDGFGGQRVYVIPSRQLVIVRTGGLALDWDDARLPNLLIGGLGDSR